MNDELYHYGIKGMHWGVRRYQNPDGTLTAAGKRRERKEQKRADRDARRAVKEQRKWNQKNASLLSDAELNAQINRLQREKQLKQLSADVISPGRKKTTDLLDRYGQQAMSAVVGGVASAATVALVDRVIKPKINPQKTELQKRIDQLEDDAYLVKEGYYKLDKNGKLKRTGKSNRYNN